MKKDEFGDFDVIEEESAVSGEQPQVSGRVKMPHNGELIGIVVNRLGGNRMEVLATDGKTRNARVPGRYKRRMWLRPRNIVIIKPWVDDDNKADIIFKYNSSAINQLRKRGILNSIKVEF